MKQSIKVRSSPSLALIKYWGKENSKENLPATSSLAITLKELYTETTVTLSDGEDKVIIDGQESPIERYTSFFDTLRKSFSVDSRFHAVSTSNFPTAAGLASSSSGFSALAFGAAKLLDKDAKAGIVSELARIGSASAARAVFGGFTVLEKGAANAYQLYGEKHWPDLSVIIAIVKGSPKKISSREAMELARQTSPYYSAWIKESEKIFRKGVEACAVRDLEALGPLVRQSYLLMFSTMFTSTPTVLYWEPETLSLIKECEAIRHLGFKAYETMDAGPQVKIICLEHEVQAILGRLREKFPNVVFLVSQIGAGPAIL